MDTVTRSRFGRSTRWVFHRRHLSRESRDTLGGLTFVLLVGGAFACFLYFFAVTIDKGSSPATEPPVVTTPEVGAESFYVNTVDGKRIPCVTLPAGVSCDWDPQP